MSDATLGWSDARSLRLHASVGVICIALGLGGLGYWAAVTPIAGAVTAGGTVVVDGGSRKVQHPEGGVVAEIMVHNDDPVVAGETLVRLDGTTTSAGLALVQSQLVDAFIRRARLLAETDAEPAMAWPSELDALPNVDKSHALFNDETRLHEARASGLDNQVSQLNEQINQLNEQVKGLQAQLDATNAEIAIVAPQVSRLEQLSSQKLIGDSQVSDIKRQLAQLDGTKASTEAEIARTRATVAERAMQIAQTKTGFLGDALKDLQDVTLSIAQLQQQQIAANDRLSRLEIKAPIAGVVHESAVQTVGGVVGAGDTLMQIVPQDTAMFFDVRVSPLDIDKLRVGQDVDLRLSGVDPRTTPDLNGSVSRVSPDLSRDPVNGSQFYLVRVAVTPAELKRLQPSHVGLVPGMPVQAFLKTTDRTVLTFLLGPFLERLALVFREN